MRQLFFSHDFLSQTRAPSHTDEPPLAPSYSTATTSTATELHESLLLTHRLPDPIEGGKSAAPTAAALDQSLVIRATGGHVQWTRSSVRKGASAHLVPNQGNSIVSNDGNTAAGVEPAPPPVVRDQDDGLRAGELLTHHSPGATGLEPVCHVTTRVSSSCCRPSSPSPAVFSDPRSSPVQHDPSGGQDVGGHHGQHMRRLCRTHQKRDGQSVLSVSLFLILRPVAPSLGPDDITAAIAPPEPAAAAFAAAPPTPPEHVIARRITGLCLSDRFIA